VSWVLLLRHALLSTAFSDHGPFCQAKREHLDPAVLIAGGWP